MPTYTFYNSETDEQFDDFMSWSQREKYGTEKRNNKFRFN